MERVVRMTRMTFTSSFTAAVILCFVSQVYGLQFNFENDVNIMPGNRPTCGIVRCSEEVSPAVVSDISSMTLYKQIDKQGSRRRVTVASLSRQQPVVSILWDGIKADGKWTKDKVEATLYLVEADDCRLAEFSCEVLYKDGLGKERAVLAVASRPGTQTFISTTVKPDIHPTGPIDSPKDTSTAAMQLSFLFQQSQTSLTGSIQHLRERIEDKISDVHQTVSSLHRKECSGHNDNTYERYSVENTNHAVRELSKTVDTIIQRLDSISSRSHADPERNVSELKPPNDEDTKTEIDTNKTSTCSRQNGPSMSPLGEVVINPSGHETPYLCDLDGGWTIIQRRTTGNVNFYRDWEAYKRGFGSLDDDFWLGNDRIHQMTSRSPHEIMIQLKYKGKSAYALYTSFYVASEDEGYKLKVGSYFGTAKDSLTQHNNMKFSTFDRDNDIKEKINCAQLYTGAWWYESCHHSNLNGQWGARHYKGPRWHTLSGQEPVSHTEMKIRPLTMDRQ